METQKLKSILLTQAQNLGADLCGIADLTADSRWIQETYGDLCASFPRAVSIAIFFPREIIQEQAVGPTRSYSYFYTAINRQLDTIGFRLSNFLQQNGFRSYPVPTSDYRQTHFVPGLQEQVASKGTDGFEKMQTELMGMFSHRFAASHAENSRPLADTLRPSSTRKAGISFSRRMPISRPICSFPCNAFPPT